VVAISQGVKTFNNFRSGSQTTDDDALSLKDILFPTLKFRDQE
jgi:hypothetical protein